MVRQGLLNRVLTSVVVTNYPQLTVTAPFMSKNLSEIIFDGAAVDQIGTATGIVNSPMPYIMADINCNILRSQSTVAAYVAQWQQQAYIGSVTIYTDSTQLPQFTLVNCSILNITPGAFDGQDPTTKVQFKGVYYINNIMWSGTV